MDKPDYAERALMLRRLSEAGGELPLVREGYRKLAEELERKASRRTDDAGAA